MTSAGTAVAVDEGLVTTTMSRWRCELSLIVRSGDSATASSVCRGLLDTLTDDLERTVSRFRADSELSRVNRSAGAWTDVSWPFVKVLTAALTAAERSGGLVDPCLGHLVDAAGYRQWRETNPPVEPVQTTPPRSRHARPTQPHLGWRGIEVRPAGRTARVRIPPGCQLDLGAIAKAWLADQLAERLVDGWGYDVVANMGGDIRAVGLTEPWTVAADPELAGRAPSALTVTDAGLATSGQGRRRWTTASGETAHHIIDPRTGKPAVSPWWTVSVLAAHAQDANTASTAAMVLGSDAEQWLTGQQLDAWLVPGPGASPRSARFLGRWPADSKWSPS